MNNEVLAEILEGISEINRKAVRNGHIDEFIGALLQYSHLVEDRAMVTGNMDRLNNALTECGRIISPYFRSVQESLE